MNRSNAKELVTLLSIVANSSRHEQLLFKSEMGSIKKELSRNDLEFIYKIKGALENLLYDLNELEKEKPHEPVCVIADDSFDRLGY